MTETAPQAPKSTTWSSPCGQTEREFAADRLVHLIGIVAGGLGAVALMTTACLSEHGVRLGAVVIYAIGLAGMLGCSAAYNMSPFSRRRALLQRLDHAAIFAMIAATYTPFTTLLPPAWAIGLTGTVWGVAGAGIALKLSGVRIAQALTIPLYLALGWAGLVCIGELVASLGLATVVLIGVGGVIYSAGVIVHVWRRLPFQNAIWHACVLVAAGVHYVAILRTVA